MSENNTMFKQIKTSDKDNSDNLYITEPILASFPANIPPTKSLQKMAFTIYQQETGNQKKSQNTQKKKRRLLKSEFKTIQYLAKSFVHDINPKDQASDYYLAIYNQDENKAYTIPVSTCYQFTQEIEGFSEIYGAEQDNEAIKQMNYMNQKKQLQDAFGTKKSQKKVTSMMTNMVDEEGITNTQNKGVRDHRLTDKAHLIQEEQDQLNLDIMSSSKSKKQLYTADQVLPKQVLDEVPYKQTYDALHHPEKRENLQQLISNSMVRHQLEQAYDSIFHTIKSNQEKKKMLKAFIYLDALVSFYRFHNNIEEKPEELSQRFKIPQTVIDHILENFSTQTIKNQQKSTTGQFDYKYVKSKEHVNKLICHILAILQLQLHTFKASTIAKMLKKEVNDLKNFFQEVGLNYDIVKENGVDDLIVKGGERKKRVKKEQPEDKQQLKVNNNDDNE